MLGTLGARFEPADEANSDRWVDAARAALGDAGFEACWAEGRAMTLEQAVEYALADEAN